MRTSSAIFWSSRVRIIVVFFVLTAAAAFPYLSRAACTGVEVNTPCTAAACGGAVEDGESCGTADNSGMCTADGVCAMSFTEEEAQAPVEEETGGRTSVGLEETAGSEGGQASGVGRISGLSTLVGGVINAVLGLVGVIFFVLMIYAGFLWMTAAGNEERVTKAKGIFVTSVIGLIVIIGAYYILDFVFDAIYSSIGAETAAATTG